MVFSVCYKKPNGEEDREKSKKFATKQKAQEAERQFLLNIKEDRIDITFEEMYQQYIDYAEESIKESTKHCKNNRMNLHILAFFGKMNIHSITVNSVLAWKSKINKATYNNGKKYSVSYKQSLFKELNVALKYGVDFCGLKENVASKTKTFRDRNEEVIADDEKIRYITPVQYNLFSNVIENIVYKAFFAFLYYMGVRKGEAQALTWKDVTWDASQVRIIKTITNKTDEVDENGIRYKITNTKNRKNRTIKMPSLLKNMMLELYKYYSDYEGFNDKWFVFGGYRHLPSQTIDNHKDKYFALVEKNCGVKINRITNHEFRHSHASYLISKGVRVELIARRLGDTVAVVLDVYAHLFPEVEDEIIHVLELVESHPA